MSIALSPKEIQERIKSGASPDEVAAVAGVPVEQLSGFIGPAMAERAYIVHLAINRPVRRRGESIAHRTLENVVTDRLAARNIDWSGLVWDAFLVERGKWRVTATFTAVEDERVAEFDFSVAGRFSVAVNHEARWLLGENSVAEPAPLSEGEPTVSLSQSLDDELYEPTIATELAESDDAFSEAELTEVDGVYDLTRKSSSSDALYDILSTINEDSVKIYTGLLAESAKSDETPDPGDSGDSPKPEAKRESAAQPAAQPAAAQPAAQPGSRPSAARSAEPKVASAKPADPSPVAAESEQPTLLDAPARPPRRKRRASVPTWDEIIFGGSKPE